MNKVNISTLIGEAILVAVGVVLIGVAYAYFTIAILELNNLWLSIIYAISIIALVTALPEKLIWYSLPLFCTLLWLSGMLGLSMLMLSVCMSMLIYTLYSLTERAQKARDKKMFDYLFNLREAIDKYTEQSQFNQLQKHLGSLLISDPNQRTVIYRVMSKATLLQKQKNL